MQNPEVVALKEDIKRTNKKLKLWERELEDRKTKLANQHSKVTKLQADLDQVTDGTPHGSSHFAVGETCQVFKQIKNKEE